MDLMENVANLTILCKIRANLSGKMITKARLNRKVVILTEEVLVLTEEEVIVIIEVVFVVIVSNVAKKGINPLSVDTLVRMKKVTKML